MSDKTEVISQIPPTLTARFVKVEDGHANVYDLPIGSNFNDGTGVLFYRNRGLTPFDEFQAAKHSEEVKALQALAAKQAVEDAEKNAVPKGKKA